MQKKLIALAVAGLASTAAFAQSNVTIYGRADMGAVYRDGSSGGVPETEGMYEFASGVQGGSRIGFKGTEDLGNGLKAIFEIEYGVGIDQRTAASAAVTNVPGVGRFTTAVNPTAAATWNNRHSYVGLSGNFGTAIAGRLDGVRYGVFNLYDPFAGGTVANFTQMTIQVDRADNAIAYISPKFFGGFGVVAAYATNVGGPENLGNGIAGGVQDAQLQTIMATYDNGPISGRLDYEQVTTPGLELSKTWVTTVGGSYDFGVVKISGLYDIIKNSDASLKQQAWFVAARAPVGKFALKAMVGQVIDGSRDVVQGLQLVDDNNNSWKWGLGADYFLSKRTNLYANYGQIQNQSNAARTISYAANTGAGNGTFGGVGTIGFDFGIAHLF